MKYSLPITLLSPWYPSAIAITRKLELCSGESTKVNLCYISGSNRLKRLSADFRAIDPSLWLLFLVAVGIIVFPVVTTVAFGTDMPPIWGLQGLFLSVVLIVCGRSFPIERFYSVNLAILVIGMALAAVIVVAPIHAIYRNTHPLHEGRNFYRQAALELTQ